MSPTPPGACTFVPQGTGGGHDRPHAARCAAEGARLIREHDRGAPTLRRDGRGLRRTYGVGLSGWNLLGRLNGSLGYRARSYAEVLYCASSWAYSSRSRSLLVETDGVDRENRSATWLTGVATEPPASCDTQHGARWVELVYLSGQILPGERTCQLQHEK